jgi:hypothetical protein
MEDDDAHRIARLWEEVSGSGGPSVAVVARCTCGCPTLDLAVRGRTSRTVGVSTILADALGQSPEGVPVNVILHAREGEISELKVISMDATEVFSMPKPEMLEVV